VLSTGLPYSPFSLRSSKRGEKKKKEKHEEKKGEGMKKEQRGKEGLWTQT